MASGDRRAATAKWLKQQGLVEELDGQQLEQVQQLIGLPSFGTFYAMLRWLRERSAIALSNASLGSPTADAAASVLQGNIRTIDEIHEMILQVAEPPADAAGENEEQLNG